MAKAKKVVNKTNSFGRVYKKHTKYGDVAQYKRSPVVHSHLRKVSGTSLTFAQTNKKLRQMADDTLKKAVLLILKRKVSDYDNNYESLFKDILRGGLQSGIINELIYYTDTLQWYKKYRIYIWKMLKESMDGLGAKSPADVFGKNWEEEDFFCQETHNQNLLAWYSFEECTMNFAYELGYEV